MINAFRRKETEIHLTNPHKQQQKKGGTTVNYKTTKHHGFAAPTS